MSALRCISRSLPPALLVLGLAVSGRAQLATNSPFLPPPSATAATAPTAGAPLEFRGFVDLPDEGLKVRIYDPARKSGTWLRVDERDPNFDFVVKQYDAGRDTVTVEFHGQTLILAQHEAKVASSGIVVPILPLVQALPPPSPMLPGPNTAASGNPNQLEALSATLAQRRALREQAAQQVNQGVPPLQPARTPGQVQRGPQNQTAPQRGTSGRGRRGG